MPKKTIRSRYQRRILDWLLDGGGTVSQASEVLGIAMPHASLAMRQLRELGKSSEMMALQFVALCID